MNKNGCYNTANYIDDMVYPKVAIIVLNFNGIEDTRRCLKSLLKTTYPNFHIFVIDNGSEKNEANILKKEFKQKRFTILRHRKNYGFSGGNNRILKKLNEKYAVLVNNDVEVKTSWLKPLVAILEKNKDVAVVQPKILWSRNKKYFDYAGACGGYIDLFGYPFTRGRIFDTQEQDRGQYDKICDVFWTSGAVMLIRNSILKKIGYFDESFFNYMEEIDLCYRIQLAGFRAVCNPRSVVYHKVASTASRNAPKKRFWEHRNNLMMMLKNYPIIRLLYIFPIRILLEYISVVYYIYSKKYSYAFAVVKSQFALIVFLPRIINYRFLRNGKETGRIRKLMFHGSITYVYFIKKIRFFRRLKMSL